MNKRNWKIQPEHAKNNHSRSSGRLASGILAGCAILFVVAGGWYHLKRSSHEQVEVLPIITAEEGPSKIRPENADEARIEHEDKLVYDRLAPQQPVKKKVKETFLPDPEKPLIAEDYIQDQLEKEVESENDSIDLLAENNLVEDEALSNEMAETDEMILADHVSDSFEPENVDVPTSLSQGQKRLERTLPALSQKTVTTGYRVQLASVKTQQQAKNIWRQLEGLPVLKGQAVHFKKVDLGAEKGIYFRVQVGDFTGWTEANRLCNRVKAAGKSCFVTKF